MTQLEISLSLTSLIRDNPLVNYLRKRPQSPVTRLLRKADAEIRKTIVSPLRAQYFPPEYQQRRDPTKRSRLDPLVAYYRKRRDINLFKQHLDVSDIFLVGHPKSGNTWLAYMLAILIRRDFGHQITLSNIGEYIPVDHGWDRKIAK